jgi:hypothetical protein
LKSLAIPILFLICIFQTQAQTVKLTGKVADAADQSALAGVNLVLQNSTDSAAKYYSATGLSGTFQLKNIKRGRYILFMKSLGYKSRNLSLTIQDSDINLGTIELHPDSATLNEVVIEGHLPPVQQHGDTVQYNADAFHTSPDAELEELLGKLPGITLQNGAIKSQGEEIQQIFVDGKPYFGGDMNAALKNIPAETIDKIQVYYKQSDQSKFTGFDDGESVKIINIITKKDKRNAQFGKVNAGYGTNDRYLGQGNINWFEGNRRISVIGTLNNNASGITGGVSKTGSAGANYADSICKDSNISASYGYNRSVNSTESRLVRNYFNASNSNNTYSENNTTNNTNTGHNISLRWETGIDSMNLLTIAPNFRLNTSENNNTFDALNRNNTTLVSRTDNSNSNNNDGYNFSGNLVYGHRFRKPGRTLSFNLNAASDQNTGAGSLSAANIFFGSHDSVVKLNQQNYMLSGQYTLAPGIAYTEPLNRRSILLVNYNAIFSNSISLRQTWNYDSARQEYRILDSALSSHFSTQTITNRAGLAWRYNMKKYNFNLGLNYEDMYLSGAQDYPNRFKIARSFQAFLPSAIFNYKFSHTSNLSINYRTAASLPAIFQLQDVVNNTNPLQVSEGNPALKQSYSQTINSRFGFPVSASSNLIFNLSATQISGIIAGASAIASKDSVINNGYLLHKGAQLTYPVNLEGYNNARVNATWSCYLEKQKTNISLNGGYNFTATPVLINNIQGITGTSAVNGSLLFSSNFKSDLDFTLSYSPGFNSVKNTIQHLLNRDYFSQNTGFRLNWAIWKGIVLNTDFNYSNYSGLSAGYPAHTILWNAGICKKFFKKQNGEIRMYVYDLLNQGSSISHTVTDLYTQDRQANLITRYFMFSAVFHLRNYY